MSAHIQCFPSFYSSTFLFETQKTKVRGCLIDHRDIWGKEISKSKHPILWRVERQCWILKGNSAGVVRGWLLFC